MEDERKTAAVQDSNIESEIINSTTGETIVLPGKIETVGSNSSSEILSTQATTDWVDKRLEALEKKTSDEINKKVQIERASQITVFGMFASVISFLTIEFQFLKIVCSIEKIAGFSLLLFSLLFSFNIGIDYLVKTRLSEDSPKVNLFIVFFVGTLAIFGILLISKGNEEFCNNNKIYERYADQFSDDDKNQKSEIEKLQTKVDILEEKLNSVAKGKSI